MLDRCPRFCPASFVVLLKKKNSQEGEKEGGYKR